MTVEKLHRKVLKAISKTADLFFELNQEAVKLGEPAISLRSTTCYFCELLDTAEENLSSAKDEVSGSSRTRKKKSSRKGK